MAENKEDLRLNYAWRYFELHANQRISLIRYYIALYSLYISACGYIFVSPSLMSITGTKIIMSLSIIFMLLTFMFYLLDHRNRALIHFAEDSLRQYENEMGFHEPHNIFTIEKRDADSSNKFRHTDCFNMLFLIGVSTAIIILCIKILC